MYKGGKEKPLDFTQYKESFPEGQWTTLIQLVEEGEISQGKETSKGGNMGDGGS